MSKIKMKSQGTKEMNRKADTDYAEKTKQRNKLSVFESAIVEEHCKPIDSKLRKAYKKLTENLYEIQDMLKEHAVQHGLQVPANTVNAKKRLPKDGKIEISAAFSLVYEPEDLHKSHLKEAVEKHIKSKEK